MDAIVRKKQREHYARTAYDMHENQRLSYPKIADFLNSLGYRGPKKRKKIDAAGVWSLVQSYARKLQRGDVRGFR